MKTYLVQTWDEHGALKNHYEVELSGQARELAELKKFLKQTSSHVVVTPVPRTKKRK